MKRKISVLTLCVLLFALCGSAEAQQASKVYRIGYLSLRNGIEGREEALLKGLRALGYVEGQNIMIEWRFAKGKAELLSELAADLIRLKVDCIISAGSETSSVTKRATSTIPIVFANVGDPLQIGLVASLARPGGNITGFSTISSELSGKRLELLREIFPKIARVGVLFDPTNPAYTGLWNEIDAPARALKLRLQPLEVRPPYDFENAFRAARKNQSQALIINTAGLVPHRERIVNLAVESRLAVMYSELAFVPAGGLMSYATDITEQFRRAATYVDKILKGTKPADLPVEQPIKFELIINLKAAKQIGLVIPPNVLARADKVIKESAGINR